MKLSEIIAYFNQRVPPDYSESWDNDGVMLCRDPETEIHRVVTCLDVTGDCASYAIEKGARLIVSHHPLIFSPLKRLDPSHETLYRLMDAGISVLSFHTRLDACPGGINDLLCRKLSVLEPERYGGETGVGRIGGLREALTPRQFARRVRDALGQPAILYDGGGQIFRVAVISGAGKDFIPEAARRGADCVVTGDIPYHAAMDCIDGGITLIDAGHYGTEIPAAELLAEMAEDCGFGRESVFVFRHDNPAAIIG